MTCLGCGATHGSVTLEILCLRSHLASARALLDAVMRPKLEADRLGMTRGGFYEELQNGGRKRR